VPRRHRVLAQRNAPIIAKPSPPAPLPSLGEGSKRGARGEQKGSKRIRFPNSGAKKAKYPLSSPVPKNPVPQLRCKKSEASSVLPRTKKSGSPTPVQKKRSILCPPPYQKIRFPNSGAKKAKYPLSSPVPKNPVPLLPRWEKGLGDEGEKCQRAPHHPGIIILTV